MTRRIKKTDDNKVFYVASDVMYMSIKDQSIDFITSMGGFGAVSDNDKAARELYRILKPGGKLIIYERLVEQGSISYKNAKRLNSVFRTVDEFSTSLKNAGFENIETNVAAEAVWAENPCDFIYAAGDIIRYCIIAAQR